MSRDDSIRTLENVIHRDGSPGVVFGKYWVIPRPVHGNAPSPEDYAVVVLADGTSLFLESFATPQAQRDPVERQRFNGHQVRIAGTIHRRMPTKGQGPIGPSVNDIQSIEEVYLASE